MPKISPVVPIDFPAVNSLTVKVFNAVNHAFHREQSGPHHLRLGQFFLPARFDPQLASNLWQARLRAVSMRVAARGEPRGTDRSARADQRAAGRASFLAVLKKFGAQDGMLSFPMPGYTLAIDFPVTDGLLEFLDTLDAMVLKRGGRVYLAKDARMSPETFRAMYPNLLQVAGGESRCRSRQPLLVEPVAQAADDGINSVRPTYE